MPLVSWDDLFVYDQWAVYARQLDRLESHLEQDLQGFEQWVEQQAERIDDSDMTVIQAGANCQAAKKTEPQMETVITTIATTNAQTSLLRLSDSSANRVSIAANRVSTAANRVSTAANCFLISANCSASCSRSCANWTSILALSSTNPACVLRSARSRFVATAPILRVVAVP